VRRRLVCGIVSADAVSSSDDEGEDEEGDEPPPRQLFFCCADDKKAGGIWYCPGGWSKCFHNACHAHATKPNGEPLDGTNKICVACHARMMEPGPRATRARTQ
jgi:hypothetical protein